jgi:hypothetical protein
MARPRIALYKSYVPAIDEGWTRWLLEDFGFAYQNVLNPDDRSRQSAPALRCRLFFPISPAQIATASSRHDAAGIHRRIEQEGRGQLEELSPSRAARWCS